MRIWIARPEPAARRTAARVAALGHEPLAAPVLVVAPVAEEPPAGPFAGLVVTSANAVAILDAAGRQALRALAGRGPVFAVGARTAAALREAGLLGVIDADGDAGALAAGIAAAQPAGAALLHVTGRPHKPEPAAALRRAGLSVVEWITYATRPVPALPGAVAEALAQGSLDGVLHYSRRSAEAALACARAAGHGEAFGRLAHHCLSGDVAAPLVAAGVACHVVAARPNEAALLAGLPPPTRGARDLAGTEGGRRTFPRSPRRARGTAPEDR